jgi:uncharacterized protein DUF4126
LDVPTDILSQLGLMAGAAAASGLRLYATVAILGFLHRMEILRLPSGIETLGETPIIVLAGALYLVEFVADKVPAFDSIWDAIHTFVRIPAAGLLAFAAFGDVEEPWRTGAALLCGTIALSSHALKASSRLAINASPEPFTNWAASFSEEFLVLGLLWLAVSHPLIALGVALAILVAAVIAIAWIVKMLRRLYTRLWRSVPDSPTLNR